MDSCNSMELTEPDAGRAFSAGAKSPQNHLEDFWGFGEEGRFEDIELLFGNTPGVLSELIRTPLSLKKAIGL